MAFIVGKYVPYDRESVLAAAKAINRAVRPGRLPSALSYLQVQMEPLSAAIAVIAKDYYVRIPQSFDRSDSGLEIVADAYEPFNRDRDIRLTVGYSTERSLFKISYHAPTWELSNSPAGVTAPYDDQATQQLRELTFEWQREHFHIGATNKNGRRLPGLNREDNYVYKFVETEAGLEIWFKGVIKETLPR